ncbi:hypothetical protein QUW13_11785 [Enterococcus hirae]|nr:hypothetical protein [Enterococcus hirae]
MKKVFWGLSMLGLLFIFAGCTNKVTQEDLKAHDWVFETKEKSEEISAIASFSDKTMTLSLDPSKMKSSAENDWEKIGEEFSKQLLGSIKFEVKYTLHGKTIHLENKDLDLNGDYSIQKKKKNISMKSKEDSSNSITLIPYKKTKEKNTTLNSAMMKSSPVQKTPPSEKTNTSSQATSVAESTIETNESQTALLSIDQATLSAYRTVISQAGLDNSAFSDKQLDTYCLEAQRGGDPGTLLFYIARDKGLNYQSILGTFYEATGLNPDGTDKTAQKADSEPNTLTDFVNKYGMSLTLYKIQVEGMTEEEALRATTSHMKSSGEIQLGSIKYGIDP